MSPNPLLAVSLDAEQMRLLRLIARPVFHPDRVIGGDRRSPTWPPWRWVSHFFHQERGPAAGNAAEVFATLPTVPRSWAGPGDLGRRYGLVWREHAAPITPIPDERVGLTITGLRHASSAGLGTLIPDVAERMLRLLMAFDDYEMNQLDAPTLEVNQPPPDVPIVGFDRGLLDTASGGLGEGAVAAVLQAEYFAAPGLFSKPTVDPGTVDPGADQAQPVRDAWWARLGNESFKRYRGLTTIDSYLARIWETVNDSPESRSDAPAPPVPPHSFLDRILRPDAAEPDAAVYAPPTPGPLVTVSDHLVLHQRVVDATAATWGNGLYSDAVFAAFRDLEHRVRTINRERGWTPKHPLDSFSANNRTPELDTSSISAGPDQASDEHTGFYSLIRGGMTALRNPRAHGDPLPVTATEAAEYFALASLLHRRIDLAEERLPPLSVETGGPEPTLAGD